MPSVPGSGMIIRPDFYRPRLGNRDQERARHGLDPRRKTGIVMFGGLLLMDTEVPGFGIPLALIIGRPGGPDFLASEVQHLGDLGAIVGAIIS